MENHTTISAAFTEVQASVFVERFPAIDTATAGLQHSPRCKPRTSLSAAWRSCSRCAPTTAFTEVQASVFVERAVLSRGLGVSVSTFTEVQASVFVERATVEIEHA